MKYHKIEQLTVFLAFLAMGTLTANAQDVMTLNDGNEIRARVIEISSTEIRYKLFENLDGPTIAISRNEVFAINYENGEREIIQPATDSANQSEPREPKDPNRPRKLALGGNMILGNNGIGYGAKLMYGNKPYTYFGGGNWYFRLALAYDNITKYSEDFWDFSFYAHLLIPFGKPFAIYPLGGIGALGGAILGAIYDDNYVVYTYGGGIDILLGSRFILNGEMRHKRFDEWRFNNYSVGLAFRF